MRDLFDDDHNFESWKAKARRILLDLDSRVDSSLYQARTWGRELWERFTACMDRFHVAVQNLEEEIGSKLLPTLTPALTKLGDFVKVQLGKWAKMIKDAGIEPE